MAQWPRTCLPMQETWVRSLGREDPLEEGIATYSSILVWEIPWTEEIWRATFHGVTKESDGRGLATKQQQQINLIMQKWLPKLFSISFNNLPFTSNVCHISREGLGSKVPFFLIFTNLCTPSSLPFHSSVFWGTTWKVTQTFFIPNGHDPQTTYFISVSFFICPRISAAPPVLLLCYWNKAEPDVGSWAYRRGNTQRVNSFLPQSEAFCWSSVRWVGPNSI